MKLNYKRTILIGFAFMSILAFWQFYDQVIPYLLENVFGLSTFAANAIMSVDNILAIFMLPLFGAISDRTRSPLGKRTPYILFGTIAAVVLMIILAFTEEARHFPGFLITLFLLLFVMSTYRTPAVAYMPDVTEKPLRSKANAIINLVGYIGGIFSTIVMMFMLSSDKNDAGETVYAEDQSFLPVFFVIAAFMLISVLILVFTIRENKLAAQVHIEEDVPEKDAKSPAGKLPKPVMRSLVLILSSVFLWYMSYNAVTTAFSRYCVNIWHTDLGTSSGYLMTATIAAIAAFVPLGFVSGALGRKKTILLGVALMSACFAAAGFITEQTPVMYAVLALVGVAWAAINVNSYPMVVEMSSGSDVGKYTGFYYTFSMAAQITTPLLSGFLIDRLGWGYSILFPYAVVFAAASFVTMCFVKHGDAKPTTKEVMEAAADMED
ncbi:MAG: MFS transporter [Clostridia bacterium]|nr:MFS transporter [Clostridia bacterium]